jgi:hypothetical protein
MAKTIKNQFSNVYGEGKNLNIGKNKSVKEMLNNIPNAQNENMNNMNNESKLVTNSSKSFHLETKLESSPMSTISSPINIFYLVIILLLFAIIGVVFYYKDMVLHYLSRSKDSDSDKDKNVDTSAKIDSTTAKVDHASSKVDKASAKIDNTSSKIDNLEEKINKLADKSCPTSTPAVSTPAVSTLNNKMDKISTYSKEQNVTENGFCYIGYDNGQRDCVDVYAGDVCMSGEIFPTLDICINPRLRA